MTETMKGKGEDEDEEGSATGDDEIEVSANEDILTQILLFLPPKSLIRSKSVSKTWRSLISSRRFGLLKSSRFREDISGMILKLIDFTFYGTRPFNHRYAFWPLKYGDEFDPDFERLDFVDGERDGLVVLQSCNGLLLCKGYARRNAPDRCREKILCHQSWYVVNPCTKEYTTFSGTGFCGVYQDMSVTLAFDPRKSLHFKLICVFMSVYGEHGPFDVTFDLKVYSSENGIMNQTGDTVRIDDSSVGNVSQLITTGVYWNDAIIWIGDDEGTYFNVDEERFGKIPMPPIDHIEGCVNEERCIRYVGESNDHFYLICTECTECAPTTLLHVYELDRGYSGWSLRFCIDLRPVFSSFPSSFPESVDPSVPFCYRFMFEIRGIVEKDDDEEVSILLLTIPGKIIQYNLKDGSFIKMCDYPTNDTLGQVNTFVKDNGSFPFIESLHPL